ncbi:MAG: flagellin [Desulfurococcales archaeon]|nr:flagellin [Desulfurococcales archaeon]
MGETTVIAHALLTIVAVSLAATFSVVVLLRVYDISSTLSEVLSIKTDALRVQLVVAYMEERVVGNVYEYSIYIKNVGSASVTSIESSDVYLGTYRGKLFLFQYNASGGAGYWNYTEKGDGDGVWEKDETFIIHVYSSTRIDSPVEFRMILPVGATIREVYPLP